MREVLRTLTKLREMLTPEGSWCRGAFALDVDGRKVSPESVDACRWCLAGAVSRLRYIRWSGCDGSVNALETTCGCGLVSFNDAEERTQADILGLLDRTIARLSEGVSASERDKSGS